jgi:prephenate dehydratase/chorismate mutase/prephenate dehydratase
MKISINDIRKEINQIDFELLKLLNTRMELALKTKKFKLEINDESREQEVLTGVGRLSPYLLEPEFSQQLFRLIIDESKKLQQKYRTLIGFQGEHGSYGEMVARHHFPGQVYAPFAEFSEVFDRLEDGSIDFGVVPVENSVGGPVTQVNELLIKSPLVIVGEARLKINYCLLTLPETDYRDIKVVYSHPEALTQCLDFLARNHLEGKPYYDTAGAAKDLSEFRWKAAAAIASPLCAQTYNLQVIKDHLAHHDHNLTRYLVLARESRGDQGNKCSILFSTLHQAGTLFHTLKLFADAEINLTRIESMSIIEDAINYAFFLDFQGSEQDPKVQQVLEKVRQSSRMYKYLGCYPEAPTEEM